MDKPVTIADKLEGLHKWLDEFQASVGLPCSRIALNKTTKVFEREPDIDDLDAEDCLETANRLSWQAFHVQRILNEEQSRETGLAEAIDKLIAPMISQVKAYGKDERKAQRRCAIESHDAAKNLESERIKVALKIERLKFMPGRIEALAKVYLAASYQRKGANVDTSGFYS